MENKSKFSVFEKTLSWLLSVVMVFGVIFLTPIMNVEAITQSEFDSKLNSLRSKYPNYSTWNDYFDGGHQCWGFARLIAYNVFGEHADNWSKSTNINDVKAGDVLQYGNTSGSGHTVFVTSVSGNTITFVDCNGNGNYSNGSKVRSCGVKWDNTISKSGSMFNKYSFAYRLVAPNLGSNPNPFPGDEDTSYAVPVSLKAKYKDNTYDGNGNIESNRWIDAGDDCYIEKVYTNGFCHVEYPAGNTRRWAYAKASLFDIPKKQVTPQGHVMSESEAAGQTIPDGDYYIVSEISQDYFIDIPGDDFKTTSGKNVEMWIWSSLMPNKDGYDCFHVEYLNNGFYRISQINTNMCLDVNGASLSRGENVQMWEKNTSNAQQWSIEKTSHGYRLRARCNAYYLDVYNGDHKGGTNVRCWEGNDSKAQSFGFIPRNLNEQPIADGVYTIKSNVNRECYLDVYGNPGEFKAGSNIQLYKFNNATVAEKYTIKYAGDGWYKISEKTSGLLIEISDPNSGFLTNSRNIQVFSDNGGKHQLWKIRKNSDGTYFIINKASGYYLDLEGSKTDNGTNVSQYPYNGNSNQRWVIELETYTISYNMNGGSGSIGNQTKTYNQDLTLSSTKPTRTGYDFVSWNTKSDGTGTNYNPNDKYKANSGATLYAIWKAKQVTVTFYRNQNGSDNTMATQTFTYGVNNQSFSNKNWSKDGHTLLGWSENRSATDKQYSTNSGVDPNWIVQKSPNVTIYAVWKANTYTISYNMNGGSGSISDQIKTYGQDLTLSSTKPTRSDHKFVGWNTDKNAKTAQYQVGGKYTVNSNATLYAIWTYGNPYSEPTRNLTLEEPYCQGEDVKWLQWNLIKLGYNLGIDGVLGKNTYNQIINFQTNTGLKVDGVCGNTTREKIKDRLNPYPEPTRNLTFEEPYCQGDDVKWLQWSLVKLGYNLGVDGSLGQNTYNQIINFQRNNGLKDDGICGETTRGKIKNLLNGIDGYIITYNLMGGSGSVNNQIKKFDVDLTFSSTIPTRIGYTFVGWNTDKNAIAAKYQPSDKYTANSGATLYAIWKINTWTVSYNMNGGSGSIANQTKTYGQDLTLSSTKPTRTGYDFVGWNTNKDATTAQYSAGGKYTANSGATLYAIWKANNYTIAYNANGGTGTMNSSTIQIGKTLTVSDCNYTKSGYSFAGYNVCRKSDNKWYAGDNGWCTETEISNKSYSKKVYSAKSTWSFDSTWTSGASANDTFTFYPIWKANTYTIAYNANGGTGTMNSSTIQYGQTFTVPNCKFAKSGYNFTGYNLYRTSDSKWYIKDGLWLTESEIKNGNYTRKVYTVNTVLPFDYTWISGSTSPNDTFTFYPIWKANTYTVSYNMNGGSGSIANQTKTYGQDLTLSSTKPTRTGYEFIGWNTNSSATSAQYQPNDKYTTNSSATLYAVWKKLAENTPQIIVENKTASAGSEVKVNVSLKNNPGISSMGLTLKYDKTKLTLKAVNYNSEMGGQSMQPQTMDSPAILNWISPIANYNGDGIYAELVFKVSDKAESGAVPIEITYDSNNVYNLNDENVDFAVKNGTVTVRDYIPGDINNDGVVNNKDFSRLFQYLSGWNVAVNEAALDVNGDGSVNNKDATRLFQYVSGWSVTIY